MGSGKSTMGRELAPLLNLPFIDLDERIESAAGKSIAEIFAGPDGETEFRKIEAETLRTLPQEVHVVACGGGTPCFHENMDYMNENGRTVYLKMFEGDLVARLKENFSERPLLAHLEEDELGNYVYEELRKRAVFYHRAGWVIDGARVEAEELAQWLTAEPAAEEATGADAAQ